MTDQHLCSVSVCQMHKVTFIRNLFTQFLYFLMFQFSFLLMIYVAKDETFRNFNILNKALLWLIKTGTIVLRKFRYRQVSQKVKREHWY